MVFDIKEGENDNGVQWNPYKILAGGHQNKCNEKGKDEQDKRWAINTGIYEVIGHK